MTAFEDSYLGRIRKLIGKERLIVVAARAVIRDAQGQVLFVRRSDNGKWVMPSGAMELDENILDCLKREVKEESGLEVLSATLMGIYTYPGATSAFDDPYQIVSVQFLVNEWSGKIKAETDETTAAGFFPIDEPPEKIAEHYHEVLEDLKRFDGTPILK
jgi:ADP-ribose pyrophosphatase YjhB (NUDIX family)